MFRFITILFFMMLAQWSWAQTYQDMFSGRVCLRCHDLKVAGTGPSFEMIAMKYEDDPEALDRLTQVVLKGSLGSWTEEVPMPPISDYSEAEAKKLVQWILKHGKTADPAERSYQKYYIASAIAAAVFFIAFGFYHRRRKIKQRR